MDEAKAVPSTEATEDPGRTRCTTLSRAAGVRAGISSRRTARRSGNAVETSSVRVMAPINLSKALSLRAKKCSDAKGAPITLSTQWQAKCHH